MHSRAAAAPPVDCAIAGPEMFVLHAVIIVDVDGSDAFAKCADGSRDADCHMRMAEVEADADIGQVAHLQDDAKMIGGGGLAEQVFNQQADAERAGKGAEMFQSGDGILDAARRPGVVALAQMHDEIAERNVTRQFPVRA